MKRIFLNAGVAMLALLAAANAVADNNFGVGVKAGTLGLGLEATWRPLPYLDVRLGANTFEYDDHRTEAGINYDSTLDLSNYYATANLGFPLSPFRLTAGAFSNGNEIAMVSSDALDPNIDVDIGGVPLNSVAVGNLTSVTSFSSTAPYLGVGFDFTLAGKVGLNLDFGVLWQGKPEVTMTADGPLGQDPLVLQALDAEALELEDELSDYKAWPVISLGFVFNF